MALPCNFPFFSIVLSMMSGIVSSVLPGKWARRVTMALLGVVTILSGGVLLYTLQTGSFTFSMGKFPAPWGNELRGGPLEGVLALFFSLVMLLSLIGGKQHIDAEVDKSRVSLYFIMCDLMLASLLALIYTNDLFTAYVFVEINTISACGLIMVRQIGRTYVAAARYMVMSLLGSGLFLIGFSMLYGLTGGSIRRAVDCDHCTDYRRSCHQIGTVPVSFMDARSIRLFHRRFERDSVRTGFQRIHHPAD